MTHTLIITVTFTDERDVDWIRVRATAAVDDVIEEAELDGKLDGKVETGWELED